MAGLQAATALTAVDHGYQLTLDPAWDIWGPAGGYIAAIALRAVGMRAEAGHRPLTLTGQFLRVARPGPVAVRVETVKPGATALHLVTLAQEGQPVFLAQVWTSRRSEPSLPMAPVMPLVPAPEGLTSQDELAAARGVTQIAFWQNIEGRPAAFRLPADPPPADPHQYRWMRFRDWSASADPFVDAMRAVLLIDIGVWPAHWHRAPAPADYVAPSLDVWVHFHDAAPGGDWLLSDADTDVSGHGAVSGRVRIWAEDGRLLASGGGQCLVTRPRAA